MTVTWDSAEIERRIRAGAMQGVLVGAHAVLDTGTQKIQDGPKSGRVYRRRGVVHQASAPGEAPASDTGRLVGSGDVYADAATVSARINWASDHARALELGTESIEPRPFARPALQENADAIRAAVGERVAAALK